MAEPRWHLMSTVEAEPGVWTLSGQYGGEYGRIEIRRVTGGLVRYRCEFRGQLIGWATSLRLACEKVHSEFLKAHGPVPFAGYPVLDSHLPQTRA